MKYIWDGKKQSRKVHIQSGSGGTYCKAENSPETFKKMNMTGETVPLHSDTKKPRDVCFMCRTLFAGNRHGPQLAEPSTPRSPVTRPAIGSSEWNRWVQSKDFIQSWEWRTLRYQVLKKRHPTCECCGASPRFGARVSVDHIKPRGKFPELALDESNLQVLCSACNQGKGNWDETDWRTDGADTLEQLDPEAAAHMRALDS